MSDDLDIRHGGALAVDTGALRDVGARLAALCARLDDASASVSRARIAIVDADAFGVVDLGEMHACITTLEALRDRTRDAADGTLLMADAYEVVELRAEAASLGAQHGADARAVQARLERLIASDRRVGTLADLLIVDWQQRRFEGLDRQFDLGGGMGLLYLGGVAIATITGRGTIPAGSRLRGTPDAVTVHAAGTRIPKAPPPGLSGALSRFPTAPGAQVRVERYTMADGSRHFIAYIAGTKTVAVGGSEPWDMRSNTQLYTGETGASYQATLDAIEAAGAQPGDRVDLVGHSQGGMIASHIAMQSPYDVGVAITVGSPDEPTLDDDQLLIQLRHSDDIVSSMAGGGAPAGTGSPDSFTASRVGDPASGLQDLLLAPHHLEPYIETAKMVEQSGDQRLDALTSSWADLDDAVEVRSTDYRAERTE